MSSGARARRSWRESKSLRGLVGLIAFSVFVVVAVVGGAVSSSSAAGTPLGTTWVASGSGSTTRVSDGTSGPAEFNYFFDPTPGGPGVGASGNWSFLTTSDQTETVHLNWSYTGLHAWFMVTAKLDAVVNGVTKASLVSAGPQSCCTTPSNGFSYSGTATFDVSNGNTYGFKLSGSNGDLNDFLQGTLRVCAQSDPCSPTPPPAAPDPPVLFGAVPAVGAGGAFLGLAGLVQANPNETALSVRLFDGSNCAGPEIGSKTGLTANANGVAAFAVEDAFPTRPVGTFVSAQASRGGEWSGCSNPIAVGPNNTSWPTALAVDPNSSTNGTLGSQGEARWFKVPILPNSRVNLSLTNLPGDFDLIVFSDIKAAYDALQAGANPATGPGLALDDLAKQGAETPTDVFNTSQYNPSAWDPTNWDPSLNTSAFSPSQWSPSQWSPSQWSASQWSPSQWSPSQWSPSQWSPSQWSPSQWSPSQWSPSQWSPSQWSSTFPSDPQLFSSAQTASLLAVSAGNGTGNESVSVNTWNNTGFLYVRVQGKNGSFDPAQPFSLGVQREGNICQGVTDQTSAPVAPVGDRRTIILTDQARMPIDSTLTGKLATLAGRQEVKGVVLNVDADATVHSLNAQADAKRGCPYAKNLAASAIKRIVDAYRKTNPIEYVVVVGDDSVVPFFRYADPALLGNETLYSPPVKDDSASQASLRLGYVLNQDGYGSSQEVSLHGNKFPVPDLAVGRLVETPAEIGGLLDAYLGRADGVVATPTSSLVTGYDFLQDAADAVAANLSAGIGGARNDTLIANQGVAPVNSWTAANLRTKLLGSGRHDLVFLAGHFSANDALAADYATSVLSTEIPASTTDFVNTIVFSAGCHTGYNIVNGDAIPSVTEPLDWAQAFARKRATLIAGTGYQYGDTDFLAYSERIYAEFSRQLRLTPNPGGLGVPVSVGKALLKSKRNYLKTTPALSALDEKALLEATLFGLPMLSVNLPQGRIFEAPDATAIGGLTGVVGGPGSLLGLRLADTSVTNAGVTAKSLQLKNSNGSNGPLATYFTGPAGQSVVPTQPILPLVSKNVTSPLLGSIPRGVGFRGGSYVDTAGQTPLTAAAATELRGVHAPFFSDVFFPVQPWTINYYDAVDAAGATRLMVTPVQHKSDSPTTSIRRAFANLDFRLFYSGNLTTAALAAAPTISGVETSFDTVSRQLTFRARVVGDVAAGIQGAWVTWTIPSGPAGTWASLDLTQDPDDASLWTGTLPLAAGVDPGSVQFMVQAVNGVGRVTLDTNVGAFYQPGSIPGTQAPAAAQTTLTLNSSLPSSLRYGESFVVTATLTGPGAAPLAGKRVLIRLGSAGQPIVTDAQGKATVSLRAGVSPGTYQVTATFAGDTDYAATDVSRDIAVNVMGTTLTLTGPTGTPVGTGVSAIATDALWLTSTLRDTGTPAGALTQRTVFVILKGTGPSNVGLTKVVQAKTDPLGRVQIGSANLADLPTGNYTVDAYFNGVLPLGISPDDVDYAPAHAQTTLALSSASIVFASTRSGNGDIYVGDTRGTAPVRLTSGNAIDAEPDWSPDHKRIAFTSTRDGNVEIYVMNADGSNVTRLTTQSSSDTSPAWSPDGTKIAFASNRTSGNWDIFVMNPNGSGVTRLTTNTAADTFPAWSSSSTRIAFSSTRTGAGDIYSMNADGTSQTRLTTSSSVDTEPAWSGSTIAFATNRDGLLNFEIYTMADTGVSQTRRTSDSRPDTSPAWSPDGAKIAFASNRPGGINFDVYTMNANGTSPAPVAAHSSVDLFPDW